MSGERPAGSENASSSAAPLIVLVVIGVAVVGGYFLFTSGGGEPEPELSFEGIPGVDLSQVAEPVAETVRDAREFVAENRRSGSAWGELGMVLFAHNFGAQAVEALAVAEELQPDERRWPYLRGMIISQSDRAAGLSHIQRAHKVDPADADIRLRLAEFLAELNQPEAAAEHFRAVVQVDDANVRARVGLASLALAAGDYDAAIREAQAAADSLPDLREAHRILAQAHGRRGNQDEARSAAEKVRSLPTREQAWADAILAEVAALKMGPAFLSDRAHQMLQEGRTDEGLALLQRLTEIDAENPRRFSLLADQLIKLSRLPEAGAVIDNGLLRHPGDTDLLYQRGLVQKNLLQFQSAISSLEEALQRKPDFAEAHFVLGTCQAEVERHADAAVSFRNVIRFEPLFAPAHAELAAALLQLGQRDEAKSHLDQARRIDPDNARVAEVARQMSEE